MQKHEAKSSRKAYVMVMLISIVICNTIYAQSYSAVNLDDTIYYILEQAEKRGLCSPLYGARPYTRDYIVSVINEILHAESSANGALNSVERETLADYKNKFGKPASGIDFDRGAYFAETTMKNTDFVLSADIDLAINSEFSTGLYSFNNEKYYGGEIGFTVFARGDLGKHVSYGLSAAGGLIQDSRKLLGVYNTYYEGFIDHDEFINRVINTYSGSLIHFPYSYKKKWDGSVFPLEALSDGAEYSAWPTELAGYVALNSELAASFFENRLLLRLGRMEHDWGAAPLGSSLSFNEAARPFLGMEAEFNPFSWFGFSTLTGVLEYYNTEGIKISSLESQNAFTISMLEFKYKNYFYLDVGEAVVWAKRYELGYISPLTNKFFYQNNTGDFDNMAIFLDLKIQYPGIGSAWFSTYFDEATLRGDMNELDRTMLAVQGGATFFLPFLAFSSLKISYTKIEPYCYTHNRHYVPWYPRENGPMELAYINNGVGIGYYLPPNSDELQIKLSTMPVKNLTCDFQYQMIRHGTDWGSGAVDGSSLLSELDPDGRNENPVLKKFFLHDGAYEWMHIVKVGAKLKLNKMPVEFYGNTGVVLSYFTNIDGPANAGKSESYSIIDTDEYPKDTAFIFTIGVRIFPD
jgi:hypothetical protein